MQMEKRCDKVNWISKGRKNGMEKEKLLDRWLSGYWQVRSRSRLESAALSRYSPVCPCRAMQRIPQGAQSVLVCLFPYYTGAHCERNISRYAMVTDYHQIAGEYLERMCRVLREQFPGYQFEHFTDNSPIREVSAAFLAGLGRLGKERIAAASAVRQLYFYWGDCHRFDLQADQPLVPPGCPNCGKMYPRLPAGSLAGGRQRLPERCRSHITQKKGELSDWGATADSEGRTGVGMRHLQ